MDHALTLPRRLLYCLISASLVCLSFPNFFQKTLTPTGAFLGWIALVPFFLSLEGVSPKRGALLGLAFGFLHLGGILYWIAFLEEAQYLSGLAWAVLVLYLGLYFAVFGWLYAYLTQKLGWDGKWMAPFLWTGLEYLRGSRPWGGFSWGEIGYTQAPYPTVLVLTSLAGVYGLTFLMVWFNASLAKSLSAKPFNLRSAFLPLGVLVAALVWGTVEIRSASLKKAGTVALLQPSVDQSEKWSKENERATYEKLGRLVAGTSVSRPGLIVWPETAAPSYLLSSPEALKKVVSIVRGSKTYHLVGCLNLEYSPSDEQLHYNAAVAFSPQGLPLGFYGKRHRVPFGEFVPFQKYLSFLGPVVGDLGNFNIGPGYKLFRTKDFSYTPMICYEVIFPGDVHDAFKTGADALVNISNDAWYGRTASAYQHAMMAVVRAAEQRKPLLRSSNSGISLVTDPFGKVLLSTRLFEETVLISDVHLLGSPRTLYSRWGNWLPWLSLGVTLLLLLKAFRAAPREAGQG